MRSSWLIGSTARRVRFAPWGRRSLLWHYERLINAVETTKMAYNIPQYSGFDITPAFFARLRKLGTVDYIKDSTGDMLRLEELARSGARVFNGCDCLNLYALMAGNVGCFSGAANAMPRESVRLYELFQVGRLEEALALWRRMQPLNMFLWTHPFNPAAKEAANISGRSMGVCRRPVMPLPEADRAALKETMSEFDNLPGVM